MKLKRLLASCVLIAAMGITMTGCSFNIGKICMKDRKNEED